MALPRREATHSGAGGKQPAGSPFRAFEVEFDYVFRALLRHGVAPSDAEDLVQDVFLVTWRRWADFDSGRPLRPWLAGIAFKVASDHLKRRRRWEPRAWLDPPDQAPGGEELLAASRARALAIRCLTALPERQRSLIVLHDLDDVPMREIASMLSVPLFTAYSRLRAARRAFSDIVDRQVRQPDAARSTAVLPGASALLELERSPPPAPPHVRRRSLARLRGLLPLAPAPSQRTPPLEATVAPGRWPLIAIASSATAVMLLGLALRGPRTEAASPEVAVSPPAVAARAFARAFDRPATLPPPVLLLPPAVPAAPRPPSVHLERGLIGHWTFEDAASGLALDRSGNENACRLQNAADPKAPPPRARSVDGISGQALQLDGTRFLSCARAEPLAQLQTAMSISLWAKPGPRRPQPQVLIARQIGSSVERYFSIALRNGAVELMSHSWKSVTRRPLPASAGPWIHIAAVHRDDGKTALYVDGTLVGRSNKSRRAHLGGGSNVLTLGGTVAPDGAPFEGALDEVRIYNRALGRAELQALATPSAPPEDASGDNKIALSPQ